MSLAAPRPHKYSRLIQAGLIAASLLAALLAVALGAAALALHQGWLHPPPFEVKVGRVEFSAPCPAQGFDCDPTLPYYAVWRGDPQPDGTIRYRLLYFSYLNKPGRR
ncbi:MAG: hypothetical protein ABI847_20320 [Anaerolineales bacterium]